MVTRAFLAVVLVACQGNRETPSPARDASVPVVADAAAPPTDTEVAHGEDGGSKSEDPEPADANKAISELGAIPAWETVIDRAQLLARRDQHGVAYGRIGPVVMVPAPPPPAGSGSGSAAPSKSELVASPYVWLIDDTEGNGSLGIRIALGAKQAKEGDRVAVGGAWHLDDARRWYWKVDSLQQLPPAPPSDVKDPRPAEPSHAIPNGDLLRGARTISVAKENEATYFQLTGMPPTVDGDGWPVANELGDPVYALLILPGERPSYGGQDMRAPDERWQLKRGQTYTLRIGRIRTRGPDKPAVIYAKTGPIRVN